MATHIRLSDFFKDFLVQDKEINLCVVGDSMTADNTGNLGQLTSSIMASWEPPIRSDGTSGWVGQGGPCAGSGSGLTAQMSASVAVAAGGVWSQQQPDVLSNIGNQYFARNLWAAASARTVAVDTFGGFPRDRQQLISTSNAMGSFKLAGTPEPYSGQYCQARLVWRNHAAGPPAGALEICAKRRTTVAAYNTVGSDVGVASSINMATGTGIGTATLNCGNGAGEPGFRVTTLVTNAGTNEAAYLVGQSFFRRSGAGYAAYTGLSISSLGCGGYTIPDLLKCLGGTTMTGADGATDAITPYISAADTQTIISNMYGAGNLTGPTHWVIRLGQNVQLTSTPDAQHNENTFLNAGDPSCFYYHYLDVINRCRAISFNLNGVYPKILMISPINTKGSPSVLSRNTRTVACAMAANVYGDSMYDAWGETYPSLPYGDTLYPWYTRANVDSTSVDGVHESGVGAWCNARYMWEAGMKSLGLDPSVKLGGQNRGPLNPALRNRNY